MVLPPLKIFFSFHKRIKTSDKAASFVVFKTMADALGTAITNID
jgi:hypothetical protein